MSKFIKALFKTIFTVIAVLMIGTGALIFCLLYFDLTPEELGVEEFIDSEGTEALKDAIVETVASSPVDTPQAVQGVSYDCYAYQQLDSDAQQVYDQIYDCMINMDECVSLLTMDEDVLAAAYEAVMADYGSIFWLNGYQYNTYKAGDTVVGMEFAPKYTMSESQRDIYQSTVDATVDSWLSGISGDASDYDKALYVFTTLIDKVDYDASSENNQNILSVFLNQATVCQGYADAAWYMLDKLGIESTIVTGTANGEAHAWNLVYLDGCYYYMDVTWGNGKYMNFDNSTTKRINYAYFAMSSSQIAATHKVDMGISMPDCSSIADSYYVHSGRYFDSFDVESIGQMLGSSYSAGESEISVQFASKEIYDQAMDYFFEQKHIADYCRGLNSIYYIMDDYAYVITVQW